MDMRSMCAGIYIMVLASCPIAARAAGEPGGQYRSPLTAAGLFQQLRQPLGQMLPFTFEGPRLWIDRKAWGATPKGKESFPKGANFGRWGTAHPVEGYFRQIQATAEVRGTGMSVGGDEREIHFSGGKLHGRLNTRGDIVRNVTLEEVAEPRRSFRFSEDGGGGFRLEVSHPGGDMILLAQTRVAKTSGGQASGGSFRAVAFLGNRTFAGQGATFTAFYRQHRTVMEADILPLLQQFGIKPILGTQEPQVRKAVLARLLRNPETLQQAKSLLADLENARFAVREKASLLLDDRFEIYKEQIRERLKDPSGSLEVGRRLTKILDRHADAERVSQTIDLLDLPTDAAYLVSLLERASPQEAAGIIGHLEKITGHKLGNDPARWREWAAQKSKAATR
jgi:hypothetical protein